MMELDGSYPRQIFLLMHHLNTNDWTQNVVSALY